MAILRKLAVDVWDPTIGYPPMKAEAADWGTWVESVVNLAFTSSLVYTTRAALFANLVPGANVPAVVTTDPTPGYDGLYMKVGATTTGSWTQLTDYVPGNQFVTALDVGAGTANAIEVTTNIGISPTGKQLILSNIFETNTATPVTIRFNGSGTVYTIKTASGQNPVVGSLPARIIGSISGSNFMLLSDIATAAIQAAAEVAAASAIAAAASITNALFWNTRAAFIAQTGLVSPPDTARILFYDTDFVPDSGNVFKNVGTTDPVIGNQIAKTIGVSTFYYTPQDALIRPENFGAKFNPTGDDRPVILACLTEQRRTKKTIKLGGRDRVYAYPGQTVWNPIDGETVDMRGEGCTFRATDAAAPFFRMLYFEFDPQLYTSNMILEGINFDPNNKVQYPLAVWSTVAGFAAKGWGRFIDLSTPDYITSTVAQTGAALSINARFATSHVIRPRVGRILKRTGNSAVDYTGLSMLRGADGGSFLSVRIDDPYLRGVFSEEIALASDADTIKVFGSIATAPAQVLGNEQISIRGGYIEISAARAIKIQSHFASITEVQFTGTAGLFTGTGITTGNVGNRSCVMDWQYGGGFMRNCQINLMDGVGLENVLVATSRDYGRTVQLVMDGLNITQQSPAGNNFVGVLQALTGGAASYPRSTVMRNVVAADSTVSHMARYDTVLDWNAAANRNEALRIDNNHVNTVQDEMVEFVRQQATAKANIISSNNSHAGAVAKPYVTQINGAGADYTLTHVSASRGFV